MKSEHTMLLWDWTPAEGVHNPLAVSHPPAQRHAQRYSAGACDSWWKESPSVAVLFGGLLAQGFSSPRQVRLVLGELAHIEDAPEWVAELLEGMDAFEGGE